MTNETSLKLLNKVASLDKAPRLLANVMLMRKQAGMLIRKQEVQTKLASIVTNVMKKQAAPTAELAANIGYGSVPYISHANTIGGLAGLFSRPSTEKEEAKWDEQNAYNLIPGVGSYRLNRRMKRQLLDDKGNTPHYWSQGFGGLTSALLAGAAGAAGGAGIGAGVGKATGAGAGNGAGVGALAGGAAGLGAAGIASIVGAIKAAVDRRRTKEEQKAYANSSTAKEYLLPGVGTYNAWKTVGRAIGDSEEREDKKKAEKKEDKKD